MGTKLHFTKMHGAGNDFIVVEPVAASFLNRNFTIEERQEFIRSVCNRHFGVGADGFMLVASERHGEVSMEYYNADGHPASFCGNGARCVARYAVEHGWAASEGVIHSPVGDVSFRILPSGDVAIHMPNAAKPHFDAQLGGYLVDTGVSHFVKEERFSDDEAFCAWAKSLRWGVQREAGGVNVNAYYVEEGEVHLRTYERGVEGETLACGTGAVATALSIAVGSGKAEGSVTLYPRGGRLEVAYALDADGKNFERIWLLGGAERIAEGDFYYNKGK